MPKQRGGGGGLGLIFVEYYKGGRKLDTNTLKDTGDSIYYGEVTKALNQINEELLTSHYSKTEDDIEILYQPLINRYPPETAILVEYEGKIPPKLPDSFDFVARPGMTPLTVKFAGFSTIVAGIDPADPNRPIGAGAGAGVGAGAVAKLNGHEVRYVGGTPVYITTLPKGTLLFRGLEDVDSMYDDLLGYKPAAGGGGEPRTLKPPYNVFFYPFPIVDKTVTYYPTVIVYVLRHDVKIASLISPSPYARDIRFTKNTFIEKCKRGDYDPCFTDKFMKENPDVTGMIAIAAEDAKRFRFMHAASPKFNQYCFVYTDSRGEFGVPEIILYPRRTLDNTKTMDSKDLNEINAALPDLSYLPYHIMQHRDEGKLATIIDAGLAGSPMKDLVGFDDELFIDKTTGFYISKLNYTGDPSRLSKDRSTMSFDNTTFKIYGKPYGGGKKRTRRRKHLYA